jgi:hypothetical protein
MFIVSPWNGQAHAKAVFDRVANLDGNVAGERIVAVARTAFECEVDQRRRLSRSVTSEDNQANNNAYHARLFCF